MTVSGSCLHERVARGGERDHPGRDIGIQRRDDDRGTALAASSSTSSIRGGAVGGDEQRRAELDHQPLGIGPVSHHHDIAFGDPARPLNVHRVHPDSSGEELILAGAPALLPGRRRPPAHGSARPAGSRSGASPGCTGGPAPARSPLRSVHRRHRRSGRGQVRPGTSRGRPPGSARPARPRETWSASRHRPAGGRGAGTPVPERRFAAEPSASGRCTPRAGRGRSRCAGRAGSSARRIRSPRRSNRCRGFDDR